MQITGLKALVEIIIQLLMVWLAFMAIQGFHIERLFRHPPRTLPLAIVLLATAIGYLCANFFIGIITAIGQLPNLIR